MNSWERSFYARRKKEGPIIPTSRHCDVHFDHMQEQIDDLKVDLKDFRGDVDDRFDQIIVSIDRLGDKLEY